METRRRFVTVCASAAVLGSLLAPTSLDATLASADHPKGAACVALAREWHTATYEQLIHACGFEQTAGNPSRPPTKATWQALRSVAASMPGEFNVPTATCDEPSLAEPGLQGEVPPSDAVGHLLHAYRCNLDLVGQWPGQGSGIQMAWYGDCAYLHDGGYLPQDPEYEALKGTVVLDASDPTKPVETTRLQTSAQVNMSESMKVHQGRGLLAGTWSNASPDDDLSPVPFEVWDVKRDCRHPTLLGSALLPTHHGHEGEFSTDGMTYYAATALNPPDPGLIPIDISDTAHPTPVLSWLNPLESREGFHGLAPLGRLGNYASLPVMGGESNGIAIVDISDIQRGGKEPSIDVVSSVSWHDADTPHAGIQARIGGHDYLIVPSEGGSVFADPPDAPKACLAGTPPYGFPRIIDIEDVAHPTVVSRIALEVNDPANCPTTLLTPSAVSLTYSSHYCAVDDPEKTTMLACSWLGSGLRVFDVRDPLRPREVAYYNPPGRLEGLRGASFKAVIAPAPYMDVVGSNIRWRKGADGVWQLWFLSMQNGFHIVRFSCDLEEPSPRPEVFCPDEPPARGDGQP